MNRATLQGMRDAREFFNQAARTVDRKTAEQAAHTETPPKRRRTKSPEERAQEAAEAYARTQNGSVANFAAVYRHFMSEPFNIPESDIKPKENCFTYKAWRHLGRQVKKRPADVPRGRWGATVWLVGGRDDDDRPRFVKGSVFHISQTITLEEAEAERKEARR
jgi:hypothetical protein